MVSQFARSTALLYTLAAGALVVPAVRADWLQLADGSRVETRGPWTVRGAQVVFSLPNGTLAALRTSQVDLAASERLTAAAKAPPPAAPAPPPRPPVLVITDEDLGAPAVVPTRSPPPNVASPAPAVEAPTAAPATAPTPATRRLEVLSWESSYDPDSHTSSITGTLSNASEDVAHSMRLAVHALDREGTMVATAEATIHGRGLAPGTSTSFVARFPGVATVEGARFEPSAQWELLRHPDPSEQPAAAVPAPPTDRLQVVSWAPDPEATTSATLRGELANPMPVAASEIVLEARLVDDAGRTIATQRALLATSTLAPGARTTFRVSFLGIREYSDVRFETRYRAAPRP